MPRGTLQESAGHDVGAAHGASIVVGEPGSDAFLSEEVIAWCSYRDMAVGIVFAADDTVSLALSFLEFFLGDGGERRSHWKGWRECSAGGDCAAVRKKRR